MNVKICPKKYTKAAAKYPNLFKNHLHYKSIRIQNSHVKFRIQNLCYGFVHLCVNGTMSESGTKKFRIQHESGKIFSSVKPGLKTIPGKTPEKAFPQSAREFRIVPENLNTSQFFTRKLPKLFRDFSFQ